MPTDEIPAAARAVINRHIRSMDHAEAVLYLANEPNQTHKAEDVAAHHAWTREIAARVLADLADTGLAAMIEDGFRLVPAATEPGALADLRRLYHRQPVTLVRAIYSAPVPMKPLIRPTPEGTGPSDDD